MSLLRSFQQNIGLGDAQRRQDYGCYFWRREVRLSVDFPPVRILGIFWRVHVI